MVLRHVHCMLMSVGLRDDRSLSPFLGFAPLRFPFPFDRRIPALLARRWVTRTSHRGDGCWRRERGRTVPSSTSFPSSSSPLFLSSSCSSMPPSVPPADASSPPPPSTLASANEFSLSSIPHLRFPPPPRSCSTLARPMRSIIYRARTPAAAANSAGR